MERCWGGGNGAGAPGPHASPRTGPHASGAPYLAPQDAPALPLHEAPQVRVPDNATRAYARTVDHSLSSAQHTNWETNEHAPARMAVGPAAVTEHVSDMYRDEAATVREMTICFTCPAPPPLTRVQGRASGP